MTCHLWYVTRREDPLAELWAPACFHVNVQERIESALIQYLRPVSNAAISTIIGIVPIAFAKSALYKVYYFRMFFVATILSWITGVIFLPVLLLSTHGVGLGAPVKRLLLKLFKKKERNPKLEEIEG